LSDKNACKMMKSMGDPSKFAILKALNHGQKYGKELATLLGLTPVVKDLEVSTQRLTLSFEKSKTLTRTISMV
ncbi:hypothetical protein PT115_09190, partial [Erysipelothrix rhusiopathiae]|nr:hypothetical protein [Erysipelothrix rhusiopathiae]